MILRSSIAQLLRRYGLVRVKASARRLQKLFVGRGFVTNGCYFASKNEHAIHSLPFRDAAAIQRILLHRRPGSRRCGADCTGQAAAGRPLRCAKFSGVRTHRALFR